jgi:hypothetical protein
VLVELVIHGLIQAQLTQVAVADLAIFVTVAPVVVEVVQVAVAPVETLQQHLHRFLQVLPLGQQV